MESDCLTDTFITIYKSSIWCIQSIYELFFKSLWQVLLFTKEEINYDQNDNKIINSIDVMSINNSAGEIYSEKIYQELPRHQIQTNNQRRYRQRLPKSNSQYSRQKTSLKRNLLLKKTRKTVRSISNQNLKHKQKNSSNTLGTINSHIVVVPIHSSKCQRSKNDLLTNQINLKQSENINLREQLADTLCRCSYEPLTFMNRGMCCGHCRPLFFPNISFHHSGHYFPPTIPQQQLNKETEFSQKSKQPSQMSNASKTQSTAYSVSLNNQSHLTDSSENEPLSTGTMFYNETNDQNQSELSFPDHDTPPSQESEELIDNNDSQLKLGAQVLVDNLIQNAQEKYQKILRMSIDQDPQNNTLDTVQQIIKNIPKSELISDESNKQKLSNDNILCQELCNKLNLSNSNQITEILGILASNAPHILKEQPPNKNSLINNSNTNKDNENTLCNQLLLHPPFKPKRLIHLCPDGTIQVLSAVDDDNSNENQIINQQQYRLNYSNSALTPSIQQNHILTNESSLPLEYETTATTTVDLKTNFNHMMFTESTSTQQSHSKNYDHLIMDNNSLLSLQQKKTLFKYNRPLRNTLTLAKEVQFNSDQLKTISQNDDPIIKINLDLNDETMEVNSEDDENSLPEIFFKRIIVPEISTTPSTEISNKYMMNEKDEAFHVRHKYHQKSRHNRSRSYTNKKMIDIER